MGSIEKAESNQDHGLLLILLDPLTTINDLDHYNKKGYVFPVIPHQVEENFLIAKPIKREKLIWALNHDLFERTSGLINTHVSIDDLLLNQDWELINLLMNKMMEFNYKPLCDVFKRTSGKIYFNMQFWRREIFLSNLLIRSKELNGSCQTSSTKGIFEQLIENVPSLKSYILLDESYAYTDEIYEKSWNLPDISLLYPKGGLHWKVPFRSLCQKA